MARRNRIAVQGYAHHVTQRGNRRANVFRDDEDRYRYLKLLREQSERGRLWIWAYALMTNHIHAIAVPHSESALSDTFRNVHSAYGNWFNKKYGLSGHLWQGRFYSCVLDEIHLWPSVRYVERNPVRAGIVTRAEEYPWSSARAHVFGEHNSILNHDLPLLGVIKDWKSWLSAKDTNSEIEAIRNATAKDIPLGSQKFILHLESKLGRPILPRKRGPKPNVPAEEVEVAGNVHLFD